MTADPAERRELAATVRRLLERHAPPPEAPDDEPGRFDAGLWKRLTELGVPGLGVPEDHGGSGGGYLDCHAVLAELGRARVATPFPATVVAAQAALAARAGPAEVARVVAEGGAVASGFTAREAAGGWRLSGRDDLVVDGARAGVLLVRAGGGLFEAPGLHREVRTTMDRALHLASVHGEDVPARRLGDAPPLGALRAVALSAEQVGGARRCLELLVGYLGTRRQFGRPIGSFQAVKHRLADLLVRIEAAESASWSAAAAWAAGEPEAEVLADVAGTVCGEAYLAVAAETVQLHGGIAVTWEHPAHRYFKHAHATAALHRTPAAHRTRLAGRLRRPIALPAGGDDGFRREVRDWLEDNLTGELAGARGLGGPGREHEEFELRRAWDRLVAAAGWSCVGWPKEHGGRGATQAQQVIFHEEYARSRAPVRFTHIGEELLGPTLIAHGTDAQRERYLPGIRSAEQLWCQGYSEPGAGSDLAAVSTRAELRGDEWVITGQKTWTSHAHVADLAFVLCRTEPGSARHHGLSYLLVPMRQEGVEVRPIVQLTGTSEFNEVFFDGARARRDDVVGEVGGGWRVAMATLAIERGVSTLGQQLGFRLQLERVRARAAETGALDDPLVADRLARAWAGLEVLRLHALRTGLGTEGAGQASVAKLLWARWHRDLGELAVAVEPDGGLTAAGPPYDLTDAQRLHLFSRADTIYGGSDEVQRNILAERVLGLPREPRGTA